MNTKQQAIVDAVFQAVYDQGNLSDLNDRLRMLQAIETAVFNSLPESLEGLPAVEEVNRLKNELATAHSRIATMERLYESEELSDNTDDDFS